MAYITQAQLEAYMGRSLTAAEAINFNTLLAATEAYINDLVGGAFGTSVSATRYYDGGVRYMSIDKATSITRVALVDKDLSELYVYENLEEYKAEPINESIKTYIRRTIGKFPRGEDNIAVTGVFGLGATVPADIQQATMHLMSNMYQRASSGPFKKESIEGYSYELKDASDEEFFSMLSLNKYTKDDLLL